MASGNRRPARTIGALAFAASLSSLPCLAQVKAAGSASEDADLDLVGLLETPFVSATRSAQPTWEAPASLHVITRAQIEEQGFSSVAEALRWVPGFVARDDYTFEHVGVRGVYAAVESPNDTIKLMINGQPVSFHATGGNLVGPELIPIEAVERIEIIRGPAAAVYGANAFLAVVNVITASPTHVASGSPATALSASSKLSPRSSSPFTWGAAALRADVAGSVSALVSARVERDDFSGLVVPGRADIERSASLGASRANGYPTPGLDEVMRLRLLDTGLVTKDASSTTVSAFGQIKYARRGRSLSLSVSYSALDRPGPFLRYANLSPRYRYAIHQGTIWLSSSLTLPSTPLALESNVALSVGGPLPTDRQIDPFLTEAHALRRFGSLGIEARFLGRYSGSHGELSLGLDYSADRESLLELDYRDERTGQRLVLKPSLNENGAPQAAQVFSNLGPNAQWLIRPWPFLTGILGARLDFNNKLACSKNAWSCFGERAQQRATGAGGYADLSLRAGVVGNLASAGYAKLLYGSSYKPPAPILLYSPPQTTATPIGGDPSLRAQNANTWEALWGLQWQPKGHLELGVYYTQMSNLLVDLHGRTQAETRNANARFFGGELTFEAQLAPNLHCFGGLAAVPFSRIEPEARPNETPPAFEIDPARGSFRHGMFPDYSGHLGLGYLLARRHLHFSLASLFLGPRRASLQNAELASPADFSHPYGFGSLVVVHGELTTHKLFLFDTKNETQLALGADLPLGDDNEPGIGGIDVPGSGPRLSLRVRQWL
jgi:outer membrane receptor protein involved in Fe transport